MTTKNGVFTSQIDIYSASWGPTDDGRTVDGPRNATMRAIVRGVNEVGAQISIKQMLTRMAKNNAELNQLD
jgi:hypothetical protein